MQIQRAQATDEQALAHIRRSAILGLAVPALSIEQAEHWAAQTTADRIARALRDHEVWVAIEGTAIGWVEVDQDRVRALYVAPSCAGRGVGSALLAQAEASIPSLWLHDGISRVQPERARLLSSQRLHPFWAACCCWSISLVQRSEPLACVIQAHGYTEINLGDDVKIGEAFIAATDKPTSQAVKLLVHPNAG